MRIIFLNKACLATRKQFSKKVKNFLFLRLYRRKVLDNHRNRGLAAERQANGRLVLEPAGKRLIFDHAKADDKNLVQER